MAGIKSFRKLLNQVKLTWVSLISSIKSFFSSNKHTQSNTPSNKQNASNRNGHDGNAKETNIESKIDEIDLEDEQEEFYDALTGQESDEEDLGEEEYFDAVEDLNEQEANVNNKRKKIYESDKFYSAENLQEVHKFIDHSNTFAIAIFEHSIGKSSGYCNDSNYQLASLQLNDDKESRACTLSFQDKQSNIKINSDQVRLYMPFYFESKKQESINYLFQYKNKDGDISTPSIVVLLEKPNSINLNPSFGWGELMYSKIWNTIKGSETKKSSRIPKALFPTFTIELEGQDLSLSINKNAIPKSMEDLKDEKPIIKKILNIPFALPIINNIINGIVDKVTSEKEKTSFRIRDILIDGKIINELQNSVQVVGVENTLESRAGSRSLI